MGSIIKVNEYKDFGNNDIMTSDGAGVITLNNDVVIPSPQVSGVSISQLPFGNLTSLLS